MADNRLPNMAGQSGMQQSGAAFNPMLNMGMGPMGQPMFARGGQPPQQFAQGMPFYPPQGMNSPMMARMPGMAPAMFPMQSMRPPGGPPPPYTQQLATSYHGKTRTSTPATTKTSKVAAAAPKPKTEKERYFEEQQKRLRQFHRPGAHVTDANALVDNLFGNTQEKHGSGHRSGPGTEQAGRLPPRGAPQASGAHPSGQPEEDDGFGDFLGGPTSAAPVPQSSSSSSSSMMHPGHSGGSVEGGSPSALTPPSLESSETPTQGEQLGGPEPKSPVEKKDLMSMMLECSDLNAPQKAKGFHKPSLMEVQKSGAHPSFKNVEVHHESDHARRWDNTQELEGLFIVERKAKAASQSSAAPPQSPTSTTFPPAHALLVSTPEPQAPTVLASAAHHPGEGARGLPEWCHDSGNSLPVVYQHVLEAVSEGEGVIVTERLYPILLMSGLQRETLGRLWNLANTHTPGRLTRSELWILLALVALMQNKYEVTSTAILKRCPQAPVPFLGQPPAQGPPQPPAQGPAASPHPSGALAQLATPPGSVSDLPPACAHTTTTTPTPVSAGHDGHGAESVVGDPHGRAVTSQTAVCGQPFPASAHPGVGSGVGQGQPPVSPRVAVLPTSGPEEEFADFQAAPTPTLKPPPPALPPLKTSAARTDDSYGEFIGGNSSLSSEQSLSSVPKEAADRLEKLYSNGGMTADEQYNSNVRNFFCSSDSSTAKDKSSQKVTSHTTPNSMDDEDFTDGHDSMSQVSTSEQSENEDIRAFENYVQEFNRKKDAQGTGDSLVLGTGSQGRKGEKSGRGAGGKGGGGPTAVAKTPPAVHFPIPGPPGPATHAPTVTAALKTDEEDFADFKSARDVGGGGGGGKGEEVGRAESSGDMVLLGEEDRYSALRSVTAAVPSLFEKRGDEDDPPSPRAQTSQDQSGEWADFSSAGDTPPRAPRDVAQLAVSQPQSVSGDGLSSAPAGGPGVGGDADDWADFAAAKSVTPSGGGGVGGEGAKASSSADNISTAGSSSSTSRPGPSSGFPAASDLRDPPTGVSLTGSGGAGWGEGAGEDWADFATAKQPAADADQPRRQGNPPTDWGKGAPGLNPANTFTVIATDSSDRGPHSSAQSSSSEVFTGAEQSAVLTVKKRNLETSEIMGVFKLRDDPTTMSSYELPRPQPPPHRPQAYPPRRSRSHSGGQGHETSPDGDDFGTVPPPLDSVGDEEDEEFSRGYDLDDVVNPPAPTTVYNPFGFAHPGAGYSRSAFTAVTRTSSAGKDRPSTTPTTTLTTDGRPHSLSPESGDTDSLSNRVSSLREDSQSVSSLDLPASKMSSSADAQRDSDNGGTDSQSVSSMEFGAGGDGGGGGVREGGEVGVCESKSLDSLDLRSGGVGGAGGEEEGEEEENDRWGGSRYGGNQPPAPGAPPTVMDPTPILADRYNLDGQQVEGSERYAFEWERCLASSCRHISGANNIFNTISSSSVCNEVLRSPQGSDYVLGLIEIYRVVCRIMTSLPTAAVTSASIEQSLKQIDLDWNNLTAFLVGASLLPDEMMFTFKQAVLKLDAPAAQLKACGVCLLDVDYRNTTPITPTPTTPNIDVLPKLSYGGRQYHAPCANFWVNCVDSMLPALKLPELL